MFNFYVLGFKTTIILIDGKRVKLQLWDTSGQGRFCTIIRSYSRGAQGILLVYDITNKWSFEGINRWLKEVDQVEIVAEIYKLFLSYIFIFIFMENLITANVNTLYIPSMLLAFLRYWWEIGCI